MPVVLVRLKTGEDTTLDASDLHLTIGRTFRRTSHGYVVVSGGPDKGKYLHGLILGTKRGWAIDHINRNKLDNRRANLRHCTIAANTWNAKRRRDNASGQRGVWETKPGRWHARIHIHGQQIRLGTYASNEEAVAAYLAAEKVRDAIWPIVPSTMLTT